MIKYIAIAALFLMSCKKEEAKQETQIPQEIPTQNKEEQIKIADLRHEEIIYTSTFNNQPITIKTAIENYGQEPRRILLQYRLSDGYSEPASVTKDIPAKTRMEFELGSELSLAKEAFAIKNETTANLQISVYKLDGGKKELVFESSNKVKLLPPQFFNWQRPEYIAAFITYQMDSIPSLQREIAAKTGGIDAYQRRDTSRVEEQVKAVYEVIADRKWHYLGGFATNAGQKIRYPAEVMREKSANCIEGALLFSAAMESLGIRTAIVLVSRATGGHAYLAWKSDDKLENFDRLLETTFAFNDKPASYEQATMYAHNEHYGDKSAGHAINVIDVKKAWDSGISVNGVN
ncbi:MAG: transglutaminase-like domain-containing protein [Fibromonadales bacterium]|nr:transglutaminase-like domain-containing protein [Fibromonadales bacterium]